ncbi:MAG: imidazolonepropionase [Bacillota bacterium]
MMNKKILKNIGELLTCSENIDNNDLGIIKNAALVIENDIIKDYGKNDYILKQYKSEKYDIIDINSNPVLPGFIDSHTHFVFGGYRDDEFNQRLRGKSYEEIMDSGGGIVNTVNSTRKASFSELVKLGNKRLNNMLQNGVTTVEGKSGYGLNLKTEKKQLKVMKKLNKKHPINIVKTFMGAHATPNSFKNSDEYTDYIVNKMLPEIANENLAEFNDVFCDKGAFSIEESRKIMKTASNLGFKLKIHADEIENTKAAELASEMKAVSAEHLLKVSNKGIKELVKNKVKPVLLPITAFSLKEEYAPARKMIDMGLEPAIATDFNPGSCFSESIPLLLSLATLYMNMTPEEAIRGLTINAAQALNKEKEVGSIEIGKKADLIILSAPSYTHLTYHIAHNSVRDVIKNGKFVITNTNFNGRN